MQSHTPSVLKWLLVERATLAGDLSRLSEKQAVLSAQIAKVEAKIQALDVSMRLVDARIQVSAAGIIRRHTQEYGRRGALKEFVVTALQRASAGLTARSLALAAQAHFSLELANGSELTQFIESSIRPQLKLLRREGFLENIAATGPEGMFWRWKPQNPPLTELASQSLVQRQGPTDGPENSDTP